MKTYKKSIFLVLSVLLFACNSAELEEKKAQEDLSKFYNRVSDFNNFDSSYVYVFSYPSSKNEISIFLNDSIYYKGIVNCDSLPGCFLFKTHKNSEKQSIIKIVCNNMDTTFILNSEIYKLIIGSDLNKKISVYSNLNPEAWVVEY